MFRPQALARRWRERWRRRPPALPKGWMAPDEDALVPPRDLWTGPRDSIHHYYRWLWEYMAYLQLLAGLRRQSQVLELGCGHGRTARALLEYLRSPGGYRGLDVDRPKILDAQERIERRWPNFQFLWADVFNAQYNPGGTIAAADYVLPFDGQSFDIVYAASLFTHLLPQETAAYLRQIGRVLKPGGKALVSFFLLDHYRGPGTTVSPLYEFDHALDPLDPLDPLEGGAAVRDPDHPDAAVAYRTSFLAARAADAGLAVRQILPGLWSNSTDWAVNEQDLLLLERSP
jgi:SAM-dependent methyltransferase